MSSGRTSLFLFGAASPEGTKINRFVVDGEEP